MAKAAGWMGDAGGIRAARVFTRVWLAMFGQWSWDDLPFMPPKLIYLRPWCPLNVYDWACGARQTIVPLTIVGWLRRAKPLPFGLDELHAPAGQAVLTPAAGGWTKAFGRLDRVLHGYERYLQGVTGGRPPGPAGRRRAPAAAVRTAAMRRGAEWIIARQEQDGCWGGIQPPWVYSLIALSLLGYGLEHPVIRPGLAGLDRFTITEDTPDGPVKRLQARPGSVWVTVLAMIALRDASLPAVHQALRAAATWMLAEEIRGPGDWQVRRPGLAPAGWAFQFHNHR